MKNQIYNFILKYTPNSILFKWSLFLNKHARILLESFAYSPALFDINGESWFLKNHPFTLKNVIDGGANKGDWTEHLIKYNKDLEKVLLIEPNHELSISLQNKYSNDQRVHIIDKGLDYRNDNVNFHIPKEGHSHGNFSSHLYNSKTKKISTTTIDKIFYEGNFDFIDLLKLDLEGFDYYALLGARKCIAQKKIRVIQFEITRSWEHSGASPCAALRFLNNAGYEIFILRPDSLEALININDMTHFSHYCNIIAILNSA